MSAGEDAHRLAIAADDIHPLDLLNEGEVVEEITFGAMRQAKWPDKPYAAIRVTAGAMHVEELPTGIPDAPTVRAPVWENLHDVWFDFGEQVTVMRGWMPRKGT